MRFIKFVVGWICFLSMAFIIVGVGLWAYVIAARFLHGARIDILPFIESTTVGQIASRGLASPDGARIGHFVAQPAQPLMVLRGWRAAQQTFADEAIKHVPGVPPRASGHQPVGAIALMDMRGTVVDAYPRQLIGRSFPLGLSTDVQADGPRIGDVSINWIRSDLWTPAFERSARKYAPSACETGLYLLRDRRRMNLGYLAISQNGNRHVYVPPSDGYVTPVWLTELTQRFTGPGFSDLQWRVAAAFLLYLILLPLWVGLDAAWRGSRPYAWGLLVALTNLIGLAAYLLGRPKAPGLCRNCGERVLSKYVRCPGCGVSLLPRCPKCGQRMRPGWQFCPVCQDTPPPSVEAVDPVEQETVRQPVREPIRKPVEQSVVEPSKPVVEPEPVPEPGSLEVIVTDAATRAAAPSVSVRLSGPSPRDGMTNARGVFEARRLEPGRYAVSASRPGHATASSDVQIDEGAHEMVLLSVVPLNGAISGRVSDATSRRPIVGASIYLDTTRIDRAATTGSDGSFEMIDIPSGPYTVCVEAEGYAPQTRLVELTPGQEAELVVALTATVKIAIEQ